MIFCVNEMINGLLAMSLNNQRKNVVILQFKQMDLNNN